MLKKICSFSSIATVFALVLGINSHATEKERGLPPLSVGCANALTGIQLSLDGPIWKHVSIRTYSEISQDIEKLNQQAESLPLPERQIRNLNLSEVVQGKKSLLVLGEGGSNFTGFLIDQFVKIHDNTREPQIHAVDLAYQEANAHEIQPYLARYRQNYHAQNFQKMDLRAKDGTQLLFDEIVAPYSLGFLIGEVPGDKLEPMLDRIVSSLASNGVLRIWWAFDSGPHIDEFRSLLSKIQKSGKISGFKWLGIYLVILK